MLATIPHKAACHNRCDNIDWGFNPLLSPSVNPPKKRVRRYFMAILKPYITAEKKKTLTESLTQWTYNHTC